MKDYSQVLTLYKTPTKEEYLYVMEKLEGLGYKWISGKLPTEFTAFYEFAEDTGIVANTNSKVIGCFDVTEFSEDSQDNMEFLYKATSKEDEQIMTKAEEVMQFRTADTEEALVALLEQLEQEGYKWCAEGEAPTSYVDFDENDEESGAVIAVNIESMEIVQIRGKDLLKFTLESLAIFTYKATTRGVTMADMFQLEEKENN